ncbi:MAG: hypothetical protein P0S96_08265 [Simkaniaceae bacterium]|nr:hypothetical protein [Candidatus Sacchlamyda saccharinae]
MPNFLLVERPLKLDSEATEVFLVNIPNATALLQEHYDYFCEIFGKEFDPEREIYNIIETDSLFWERVMSDHVAKGILYGYGKRNALFFKQWVEENVQYEAFDFSTVQNIEPFNGSKNNFSIPCFPIFNNDSNRKKYEKERKKIARLYRGKAFLDVNMDRLRKN